MDLITKRIYEIADVVGGGTPSTSNEEYWGGDIPWLSPADLTGYQSVYISHGEKFITPEGVKKSSTQRLPAGSVLFSSRAPIGYIAIAQNEIYTNQGFKSLVCKSEVINNLYLYYYLKLNLNYIKNFASGATFPELSANRIKNIKITFCKSLHEQQKIASILSAYDSQIENNQKRIKLLEQMAENLYKEWFVRFRFPGYEKVEFEGGVPKGWKRVSLREYANVIMGQSPESCFYNTEKLGLPFHQGCGSYGEFYLRDDIYSTEGKRIAEPNSIIFSVRAPVGRINLTLNKIILGRGVAGINAKNNNNAFLLWLLKQKFSKEDIIGNGAIFTSVTKNELLGQKLLIPNKELERKFNIIASNIETEIKLLTLQKEVLTTQRDLLLPRLMSGKLSI